MQYRTLGRTGLKVSEVGFGAWGIGGMPEGARAGYGPTDDDESLLALEAAFDMGANFIDTADAYGFGHSEEVVGRFLQGKRDRVFVATKFGHKPLPDGTPPVPTEANVRQLLAASLQRLNTDYVDVYQWHEFDLDLAREHDLPATMGKLKAEGLIRHAGICVYGPTHIRQVARGELGDVFETIQESYNPTTLAFTEALREAGAAGLGIIVREPMGNGLLTGRLKTVEGLDPRDARAKRDPQQAAMRIEFSELLDELLPADGRTLVQGLIRFALQNIPASVVIPGCKTVGQVRENLAASDAAPLTDEQIARIYELYEQLKARYGFMHPYAKAQDDPLGAK